MRNLKKILALALVFAMAFTFAAGAADFTDAAEINAKYADDVNMLVELGVIAGYPDGSFGPQKNITRAEFAKMAYTLKYGSDANGDLFAAQKSVFTDVEGNANVAWAKGYINYCANQKIVSGVGNNKFNPQGNITVAEAAKMILVILGCDPAKEGFTGANWAANVTSKAIDLGVFDGWSGDPMSLATRELVAKLMRNAVFSPVYTYSTITGEGSQMNVFQNEDNITLGEKTMGLISRTGIVVANERYELALDAEGEAFLNADPAATGDDSDASQIYYVSKNDKGEKTGHLLEIPVALSDDYLGNEVTVFFKADAVVNEYATFEYEDIELVGNAIVTSDTVVYEVPAVAVDVYPNKAKASASSTPIVPYIGFTVDGVEKKVMADRSFKVPMNTDFGANEAVVDAFAGIAYDSNATFVSGVNATDISFGLVQTAGEGTETTEDDEYELQDASGAEVTAAHPFFAEMGAPVLSNYRFVSVDGGKTYSYIFKMVADDASNINYGTVTSYSEAKGTMRIAGVGNTLFLDEINVEGEIAADDKVVYFFEDGMINVVKVDEVTGAVEALNDDGSAVINGETYFLWANDDLDVEVDTLTEYYTENPTALNEDTTYYAYGNIILDFEVTESEAVVEDYALILGSSYNSASGTASVTLAFADNTQKTYEVGELHMENRKYPANTVNDRAADFADNRYFGMLVKYKIMEDGTLDLSAQDLERVAEMNEDDDKDEFAGDTIVYENSNYGQEDIDVVKVYEGVLEFDDGSKKYAANDASVVFVIYGAPKHVENNGKIETDWNDDGMEPIKAVAYKFADKKDNPIGAIGQMISGSTGGALNAATDVTTFSYVESSKNNLKSGIVAAALTVAADSGLKTKTDNLAYIVNAIRKYDVAAQDYYLQMTVIGDDGLFTANTAKGARMVFSNGSSNELDFGGDDVKVGELDPTVELSGDAAEYLPGNFITYELNAEGEFSALSDAKDVGTEYVDTDGLYLVNVVAERSGKLFFFNTNADLDENDLATDSPAALDFNDEEGYTVITIDGGEYAGEQILKISKSTTALDANIGNAVIEIDEGEIVRVIAFTENLDLN